MNSCILMATIASNPQLRYTQENLAIAEMLVEFDTLGANEAPATLKVIGWGNLAGEIKEKFQSGDRVVIEGRLHMNTIDRQEGFKEKRAELTASRIHLLDKDVATSKVASTNNLVQENNLVELNSQQKFAVNTETKPLETAYTSSATVAENMDDIPF